MLTDRKMYFLILLFSFPIFVSCGKVDCEKLNDIYRQGSVNIIVDEMPIPFSRHNFLIKGKTVKTKLDTVYDEENRWLCGLYNQIDKGDTLIKRDGESVLEIHKRDTVHRFDFFCDGKNYK